MTNIQDILKRDEGVVYKIYLDHLGYPTFGVGHLIRKNDPEYGKPVGTPVSEERVWQAFDEDLQNVQSDVDRMFSDFCSYPHNVQIVILSMMFQLGYNRLSKFKRFRAAIARQNWMEASKEMLDSKWAKQTPKRVARLRDLMENA